MTSSKIYLNLKLLYWAILLRDDHASFFKIARSLKERSAFSADMGAHRRLPAFQHCGGRIHDPQQRGKHALGNGQRALQQGKIGAH